MNHSGFEDRLSLAKAILREQGLEPTSIDPIEYDPECPFPYNNFIYKISLKPTSLQALPGAGVKPCTLPPKAAASAMVLRLSNPDAEGLNQANRVENEVAAMQVAREALDRFKPGLGAIVPAVHMWQARTGDDFGWILMEFKSGMPLDQKFKSLSASDRISVIEQAADIFAAVNGAKIPDTATSFGGFTISGDQIVSGQMTTLKGGPWSTYAGFYRAKLASQLEGADGSPVLQGWRPNGVRERIDKLQSWTVLENVILNAGLNFCAKTLIHGDLTMNNMLFDPEEKRITGLVDFDFAFISHPCQEFFSSLHDLGGNPGSVDSPLKEALLTGRFDNVPEEASEIWEIASAWDSALARRFTLRLSKIEGIYALDRLRELESLLCPFRLVHPVFLKRKTDEQVKEEREAGEKAIVNCLDALGVD